MKHMRILSILFIIAILLSFASCSGNYGEVDLKNPVPLPEDGIIEKGLLDKIKKENAIATFTETSGGLDYEWKIFGNDIEDTKDVNLLVALEKIDGGVKVSFESDEAFGFDALLSIHLDEKWTALAASAYKGGEKISSVSITGSDKSILNLSVNGYIGSCVILPDVADVPEETPTPVEPEDQKIDKNEGYTCTFSIECSTILNNLFDLDPDKLEMVPSNGVILAPITVTFYEGESVFDVLQRVCKDNKIHLESSWTPMYNSAYIEGIANLYEFDCGSLSGWMYRVNGWYPNYGCSQYILSDGDVVEWRFTCDLGKDIGEERME